jgi:hypothetical protein
MTGDIVVGRTEFGDWTIGRLLDDGKTVELFGLHCRDTKEEAEADIPGFLAMKREQKEIEAKRKADRDALNEAYGKSKHRLVW